MSTEPAPAAELLVACLCAQWCRTCDAYRDTLLAVRDAVREGHPGTAFRFVWIDIEDDSEVAGDMEVEDFPTVVLASGTRVVFAGPILPHPQTLERLVRAALEGSMGTPGAPWTAEVQALPARLAARPGL